MEKLYYAVGSWKSWEFLSNFALAKLTLSSTVDGLNLLSNTTYQSIFFLRFQFLVDDAVVHKVLYVLAMYHQEDFSEMAMWQVKLW